MLEIVVLLTIFVGTFLKKFKNNIYSKQKPFVVIINVSTVTFDQLHIKSVKLLTPDL